MRRNTRRQKDHDDVGPIYPGRYLLIGLITKFRSMTYRIDHLESVQMKDLYLQEDFERIVIGVHLAQDRGPPHSAPVADEW